jgi:hypothetical protein
VIVLALTLLIIALATLWPVSGTSHQWLFCLACGTRGTSDLLLNIALFVPFGAALARLGHRARFVAGVAVLLSSAIELAQFVIPGRDPTLGDVVANTAGAWGGALLVRHAALWIFPSPAAASRLCRVAVLAAVGVCLATGFLLTPVRPAARYYGLWTPQLGHLDWYQGRVLDATLGTVPITPGELPTRVRDILQASAGYDLRVRAVVGPPPEDLAPLVAIFDDRQREILLLGIDRGDLVWRERTRAISWRFDRPDLRTALAPGLRPGDTLRAYISARHGHYIVEGEPLGFTMGQGWGLLAYPEHLPFKPLFNAIWVGALFVPAGFWWRARRDGALVALGIVTGLILVPAFTPLVATPPLQWAGALLGLFVARPFLQLCSASARTSGAGPDRQSQVA